MTWFLVDFVRAKIQFVSICGLGHYISSKLLAIFYQKMYDIIHVALPAEMKKYFTFDRLTRPRIHAS